MTTRTETDSSEFAEGAPPLGELLLRSATNLRDRVAVRALVEEGVLLARDTVRTALVVKAHDDTVGCGWERFAQRLCTIHLTDEERAFAHMILSLAGPHQTSLSLVLELDDRRLGIVLRAMVQLSGTDALTVVTLL
ncbi:hypothetical protein [Streptomyces sp. NPDC000878]